VESRFVQVPKPETRADLRKERGRLVRGLQAPFSKRHADEASALLISLFLNRHWPETGSGGVWAEPGFTALTRQRGVRAPML
jgi:hypothetical protein